MVDGFVSANSETLQISGFLSKPLKQIRQCECSATRDTLSLLFVIVSHFCSALFPWPPLFTLMALSCDWVNRTFPPITDETLMI